MFYALQPILIALKTVGPNLLTQDKRGETFVQCCQGAAWWDLAGPGVGSNPTFKGLL